MKRRYYKTTYIAKGANEEDLCREIDKAVAVLGQSPEIEREFSYSMSQGAHVCYITVFFLFKD